MTREQIKDKLQTELNGIYCQNCARYGHEELCEWCHRKSMGWKPSDQLLEWIMDVCGVEKDD